MTRSNIFVAILFMHLAFRRWFECFVAGWDVWQVFGLVLFALGAATYLWAGARRFRQVAVLAGAGFALVDLWVQFPVGDNHGFVETFCLLIAAVCSPGRPALEGQGHSDEGVLLENSLKIILAMIFVHAGWQKVAYGAYFNGSFLLMMAGINEGFRPVVEWALGSGSNGTLAAIGPEGPFQADSIGLWLLSNGIYAAEIATGILLLIPRTRKAGLVLLVISLVAIEFVARELVFGLLCLNLAMLHLPRNWAQKSIPAFFAAYLLLLISVAGLGWEIYFK